MADLIEGYYWVSIQNDPMMGSGWQIGWYHLNYMQRPVWSICGRSRTYPASSNVIVGPRLLAPAIEAPSYQLATSLFTVRDLTSTDTVRNVLRVVDTSGKEHECQCNMPWLINALTGECIDAKGERFIAEPAKKQE